MRSSSDDAGVLAGASLRLAAVAFDGLDTRACAVIARGAGLATP